MYEVYLSPNDYLEVDADEYIIRADLGNLNLYKDGTQVASFNKPHWFAILKRPDAS